MTEIDYYQVLNIAKDATAKQVKEAYRAMAFRYHPDRAGDDPAAAEQMKRINEAYAVLSNPAKRSEYDALHSRFGASARQQFRQAYSDQDIFKDSDIWQVFEEMARSAGFRGFEDVFREFYGPGFRQFECRRPGFFARGFLFTGAFGGRGMGRGLGRGMGGMGRGLRGGGGRGLLRQAVMGLLANAMMKEASQGSVRKGRDSRDTIYITPNLSNTGGPYAYLNQHNQKKLIVKIPPGVRDGQRIRLAGQARSGKPGETPGDLYLTVRVQRSLPERVKGFISGLLKSPPKK